MTVRCFVATIVLIGGSYKIRTNFSAPSLCLLPVNLGFLFLFQDEVCPEYISPVKSLLKKVFLQSFMLEQKGPKKYLGICTKSYDNFPAFRVLYSIEDISSRSDNNQ